MRHKLIYATVIVWSFGVLLCSSPGYAQTYPDATKTEPFMPESNYMSLYGYLRWQYALSYSGPNSRNPLLMAAGFLGTRQEFESRLKAKAKAALR